MPLRLSAAAPDFEAAFARLLAMKRETSEDVDATARDIIADVRARGDAALVHYTATFDWPGLGDAAALRVSSDRVAGAIAQVPTETFAALELAAERIRVYHEHQKPFDHRFTDALGVELGWRWTPVPSVGLYVPGGLAAYPSSVLMNAIPAKVAGVPRIVMAVPTQRGALNPLVLAAASLAGIDEIFTIGGAQAIAALAYGTASVEPVSKIVGPGNAYVAAAKRRVFGAVGIDMIAGPSEVLVIADSSTDPQWIAADLLAQAEHDASAQSILITDDEALADAVESAVARQLQALPRAQIAGASWRDFGAIVLVGSLAEAPALADRIAPEHLELMGPRAEALSERIVNAGAIFLGAATPEAIGDYVGGSNHVLPTARSARFSSGLGVQDFMKRTSILRCPPEGLTELGPAAIVLGKAEGLDGHARSVAIRLGRD